MYSLIDSRYTLSRGRLLCRVFHIFRRERNIFCFVPNAAARSRKALSSVGTAAKKLKRPRLKQIPHLRRSPPQRKLPSPPAAKSRRKRRPFSSFPCSHFCLSPWLLPTAACSKATLPQKRKSVSSAAGTEYFWKMETIPSAQKISVALPAPLKRVVRLQFHSQNAPFLIYPST